MAAGRKVKVKKSAKKGPLSQDELTLLVQLQERGRDHGQLVFILDGEWIEFTQGTATTNDAGLPVAMTVAFEAYRFAAPEHVKRMPAEMRNALKRGAEKRRDNWLKGLN